MNIDRRTLLAAATVLLLPRILTAQAAAPLPPLARPVDRDALLALSRAVTGHNDLSPVLADRILAAMIDTGRERPLRALYEHLAAAGSDAEAVKAALQADGEEVTKALLRAWYVGVLPGGKNAAAVVVGYEECLMGRVVADFIPLRSYCGGAPHFWTEPPLLDDLPLDGAQKP